MSYKTHPHLDLPETGEKAATILLGALLVPIFKILTVQFLLVFCRFVRVLT